MKKDRVTEAKKLLEEEQKKRGEACMKEIQDTLKKHNCDIVIAGQFQGDIIKYQINVVAK